MSDFFYPNYNLAHPAVKQGMIRISKIDYGVQIYDNGKWKNLGYSQKPIQLGPCTNLGFSDSSNGQLFSWVDPVDVTVDGSKLSIWNQTVLVRKEGADYPVSPEDGVIVATTSVKQGNRNYYLDHAFLDETQEQGKEYKYMLFSQADNGSWNNLTANQFTSDIGINWAIVRQHVLNGTAPDVFPVGTVFYVDDPEYTHSDGTGLWMRVAGHDQVPAADETLTHTMCLDMVDCLFTTPSDVAELEYALTADTTAQPNKTYYTLSGSTYSALTEGTDYEIGDPVPSASWYEKNIGNRNLFGSNNPKQNNLINWLNSDGTAGSSIQPMTIWDLCGSTLMGKNGFLKNIDPLFLAVVKPAKLTSAICAAEGGGSITHTAKFWPLSITQVFGDLNNGISENVQLDYYKNGGSRIKNEKDTNTAVSWRLRSAFTDSVNPSYVVTVGGNKGRNGGADSVFISTACIIA